VSFAAPLCTFLHLIDSLFVFFRFFCGAPAHWCAPRSFFPTFYKVVERLFFAVFWLRGPRLFPIRLKFFQEAYTTSLFFCGARLEVAPFSRVFRFLSSFFDGRLRCARKVTLAPPPFPAIRTWTLPPPLFLSFPYFCCPLDEGLVFPPCLSLAADACALAGTVFFTPTVCSLLHDLSCALPPFQQSVFGVLPSRCHILLFLVSSRWWETLIEPFCLPEGFCPFFPLTPFFFPIDSPISWSFSEDSGPVPPWDYAGTSDSNDPLQELGTRTFAFGIF